MHGLSFRFTPLNFITTKRKCSKCSSHVKLCMLRSLTNTFKNLSIKASNTLVIVVVKVLVACIMSKGMYSNQTLLRLIFIHFLTSSLFDRTLTISLMHKTIKISLVTSRHLQPIALEMHHVWIVDLIVYSPHKIYNYDPS
jgi:hypothetical protein